MSEESHLDEMRTAIRGDFERLARRRGDQELMRVTDAVQASAAPEAVVPSDDGLPGELDTRQSRRSWLARLVAP